jgi:hypothetical protein
MNASFTLGKGRKKRSKRPKRKPAAKMSLKIKGSPGQVLKAIKRVARHGGETVHGINQPLDSH